MRTDERLEKLEKELARAKRRRRRVLAVAALVVGAFALVWIVAGTANRADAQGAVGGAAPVRPCRYQLAVTQNRFGAASIYMLDQRTADLYVYISDHSDSKSKIMATMPAGWYKKLGSGPPQRNGPWTK